MKYLKRNKSYVFRVSIERDDDAWRAFIPELEQKGASTWGRTEEEALRNIQEVAQMVVEELLEEGKPIPMGITVSEEPVVAITV